MGTKKVDRNQLVKCSNCRFVVDRQTGTTAVFLKLKGKDKNRGPKFAEFYVKFLHRYLEGQCDPDNQWPEMFKAGLLKNSLDLRYNMVVEEYNSQHRGTDEEVHVPETGFYEHFLNNINDALPKHDVTYFVVVNDEHVPGQYDKSNICAIGCIEGMEEGQLKTKRRDSEVFAGFLKRSMGKSVSFSKEVVFGGKLEDLCMGWFLRTSDRLDDRAVERTLQFYANKHLEKKYVQLAVTDAKCTQAGEFVEASENVTVQELLKGNTSIAAVYETSGLGDTDGNVDLRVVTISPVDAANPGAVFETGRDMTYPHPQLLRQALKPNEDKLVKDIREIVDRLNVINMGTPAEQQFAQQAAEFHQGAKTLFNDRPRFIPNPAAFGA